jgi:hypothetical protein
VNWGQCGDEMPIVTVTVGAAVVMLELVTDCVPIDGVSEWTSFVMLQGGGGPVLPSMARVVVRGLDTYSY